MQLSDEDEAQSALRSSRWWGAKLPERTPPARMSAAAQLLTVVRLAARFSSRCSGRSCTRHSCRTRMTTYTCSGWGHFPKAFRLLSTPGFVISEGVRTALRGNNDRFLMSTLRASETDSAATFQLYRWSNWYVLWKTKRAQPVDVSSSLKLNLTAFS